jgi:hypothetical protein
MTTVCTLGCSFHTCKITGTESYTYGGGPTLHDMITSSSIRNCWIINGYVYHYGGGIGYYYLNSSSPVIHCYYCFF